MKFWWAKKSEKSSLISAQVLVPTIVFFCCTFLTIILISIKFQDNHLRSEQLLSYIEFERMSESVSRSFEQLATQALSESNSLSELSWTEKGLIPVAGNLQTISDWDEIKPKKILTSPFVVQISGATYIATMWAADKELKVVPESESFDIRIKLAPFDISQLIRLGRIQLDEAFVYLVSKEGQLIFSTSALVNHKNFLTRPVVQKFVMNQVTSSGLSFKDADGKEGFGYSFQIFGSNLIMFSEVSVEVHSKGFFTTLKSALVGLGLATVLISLIFYRIHRQIYRHLKELALSMERTALIPVKSEFKQSNIREIAFLKESYLASEQRLLDLYQKVKEKELAHESVTDSPNAS